MKQFTLVTLALCLAMSSFAQTPLQDGNKALQAKNYPEAIKQYEAYFAGDQAKMKTESETLYNLATSYMNNKNFDKAITSFNTCIVNNYKPDFSTYYMGNCYKAKGDHDDYIKTMNNGLNTYKDSPVNKGFKAAVANDYVAQGYKVFQEGGAISKKAGTTADTYVPTMDKALKKYDEAQTILNKALAIDPNNATATKIIASMDNTRKAVAAYKAELKK